MLPAQLVRVRVSRGKITPLFASQDDLGLASLILDEFRKAYESRERKGVLMDRIREMENCYDHRLVRGLCTILERRCVFRQRESRVHPAILRREVFSESSRRGFALTNWERMRIIEHVASNLKIDPSSIDEDMWSDLDDNLIMEEFRQIDPESLIAEYNMALIQGLLMNCTRLECSVQEGVEWKNLLRKVKRLGLIYMLDDSQDDGHEGRPHLLCTIDGPASVFRLTDRYGVAMARLLPTLLSSRWWWIRAWIARKSISMGMNAMRIYEFRLSKDAVKTGLILPSHGDEDVEDDLYDSSVEERFAILFNQYSTGWVLRREPEPIALSGHAFIPDFVLEKYGRRVYLEILGFWTKEYIERKVQKLIQVKGKGVDDIILLVNRDLICSEPIQMDNLSRRVRMVTYDGKSIPMKQIMDHLKSIEDEITARYIGDDTLLANMKAYMRGLKDSNAVISIKDIAEEFNITYDAALSIITGIIQKELPEYEMVMNTLLIQRTVLKDISMKVSTCTRFVDACRVLEEYGVPDDCCTILLSLLGYTVVWNDIDMNNAIIVRNNGNYVDRA